VYQRAFVTIKQGIISWRGFNVAPVKVVIMQNHREKVNEKGKNFCHVDVAIDIGDMGPRSPHLAVLSPAAHLLFWQSRLLGLGFQPTPHLYFLPVYYDGGQRQFLKLFAMKYAKSS